MQNKPLITETQVRERVRACVDGPRVEMVPGGPALVRGATAVIDDDGAAHPARRPVVAVCACGLSQRAPWCDATHKVAIG
ncbi:MAG: iron-sulfur protein [Marmoricola sp.]|nr:iron-sulfur protein [Marmoricola sp.]